MPWKVVKRGDQHCVVVSEGEKAGKTVKCYSGSSSESKAKKLVAALYANTSEGSRAAGYDADMADPRERFVWKPGDVRIVKRGDRAK